MKFFKGNTQPEPKSGTSTSAATWQSIASGDSVTLHHSQQHDDADGSGFLNPESSLRSNRALETSEWSKERSSQQLELEDVHDTQKMGCCRKAIESLVKALHVIDVSIGIALIVYGSLLYTQFQPSAKAAVVFCLVLGTIHLSTSLLGILSWAMKGCSRFGLVISGYIGAYVALVYFTIVLSLIIDSSGFLQYLDDHKKVMYLGPNVADNCRKLMPLFYTILIALGLLEALRCWVLIKLQERLLRHDAEESLIPRPRHDITGLSSANNALTEALLEGNESETLETGGGAVGKETTGTPNWWEKN